MSVLPHFPLEFCDSQFSEGTFKRKRWKERLKFGFNIHMDQLRGGPERRIPGHITSALLQSKV